MLRHEEENEHGCFQSRPAIYINPPLEGGGDLHPIMSMPITPQSYETQTFEARDISYLAFLKENVNYRWFIVSYLITHFGEWLTYIAAIDFIETVRSAHHQSTSRTAISVLILVRLLPNVVLSAVGGSLADTVDRRLLMIGLDILGAFCAGFFVYALQQESIWLLYFAMAVQQCIAGLYAPAHSAIIPQLVESDAQLKKATTLEGLTWSAMQAFGAAASGWIVDALGLKMCFIVDGISYAISALFLAFVQGEYKVPRKGRDAFVTSETQEKTAEESTSLYQMIADGANYIYKSYFGTLILLKGTAALCFGACDILNVAFSEDGSTSLTPNQKLGIFFSLVGIGCLIGPLVAEPYVHVNRPTTLQVSCVISFGLSFVGYFGWAFIPHFWSICLFAVIRAAGSSNIWIHSTLLLQKFSAPHMMGRVLAADYAVALICEAAAAYICGSFMDHYPNWSPYDVSFVLACFTCAVTLFWTWYHLSGKGASKYSDTDAGGRKHVGNPSESSTLLSCRY